MSHLGPEDAACKAVWQGPLLGLCPAYLIHRGLLGSNWRLQF